MFFVVLSTILALMTLYVWKRAVKDSTRPGRTRRVLTVALVALTLILVAALLLPRTIGVTKSTWFAWPGFLWFAVLAYLFLTLLAWEPVRLALRWWVRRPAPAEPDAEPAAAPTEPPAEPRDRAVDRRMFLAHTAAVTAGAASVGLVGFGAARALGPPDVPRIPVRLAGLDPALNGFRIAVVSDIHLGTLSGRAHTERIVATINEVSPDVVAIVGDLVDGSVADLGRAAEPLRDLVSREGSFFVTGNHEYFVDDTAEWLQYLEGLGVQPLRNEHTVIRRGAAALNVAGVDDIVGERYSDGPDFERALAGRQAQGPTVLLAHQPVLVDKAAAHGVDLQLSGHTHGGQMWPFHYAVRAVQPSLAGLSSVGDTQLYVTRGAGFWGPPVRVGAPPEIAVVTLEG